MSKSNNESSSGTHVDMWQPMSGRKSTIKDKWIGCNPKSHLEVDKWQEREGNSLDPCLTNRLGEGERREGRRREFLEREALTSL